MFEPSVPTATERYGFVPDGPLNNDQLISLEIARQDREYNERALANYLSWSENMANSEIQRRVADYRAAGLNPYLAYSTGGASTPSASPTTSDLSSAYQSALSIGRQKQRDQQDALKALALTALAVIKFLA